MFEMGWVTFSENFRANGASPTNDSWRQNSKVHGLSRGTVCMILRLAVLVQYRRVMDGQADGRTDGRTTTANTRDSIASRG